MGCFYPLAATKIPGGSILIHKRTPGIPITPSKIGKDIKLPCGRCHGCRLDRSKQWSVRLMHEAQLHKECSFLTLTINEKTLTARGETASADAAGRLAAAAIEDEEAAAVDPNNLVVVPPSRYEASLRLSDLQSFMKRLRANIYEQNPSSKVRFYGVGEYGSRTKRPHYHMALFGHAFTDDRTYWRTSGDYRCYRSSRLEKAWKIGNCEIGELTTDSAAYIAGYIIDKMTGNKADEHYRRETPDGEIYYLQPEFALMSRRPGIGRDWYQAYKPDVDAEDCVIIDGRKLKPPRYYDKLKEAWDPVNMEVTKLLREERAKDLAEDNTPARLLDKEIVAMAKLKLKVKSLEQK